MAGRRGRAGRQNHRRDRRNRHEVIEDQIHVNDLHATILKLLGFDHTKLTSASRAVSNSSPTWAARMSLRRSWPVQ